tara:strand:+ start:1148 stop:1831 length:684 start_codon:yes stop_codon:yes gene_type:complete
MNLFIMIKKNKITMESNKLIAEFMGNNTIRVNVPFEYELDKELPTSGNICKTVEDAMEEVQTEIDEGIISGCDLCMEESSYHTSWDLLMGGKMPVIEKIRKLCEEPQELDELKHALLCVDIESVYSIIVEFIKEYNKKTMESNKLIAEFMGHKIDWGFNKNSILYMPQKIVIPYKKLKYHTSWDWLDKVVHKIKEDDLDFDVLEIGLPIDDTYEAVVEFIKEYNKKQ